MSGFGKLVTTEAKLSLRDAPVGLVAVVFPAVVVAIFGVITHPGHGSDPTRFYFQPMSLAMGIGVLAFSLMATAIASYREQGILRRLATTPVSPVNLLGAQLVVNLAIAVATVIAVVAVGTGFGFPFPGNVSPFLVTVVLSLAAMLAIGLCIAAVAPVTRTATSIGVAFYFVNLIVGGIFVPPQVLPATLARVGEFAPLGAMLTALQDAWRGTWPPALPLAVLASWAVVAGALAVRTFRWE